MKLTDEQRAAVERLRKDDYGKSEDFDYTEAGWWKRVGDEAIVSDMYLAEHPADDGEPVTEEWLRSVGFWRGEQYGGDDVMMVDVGNPKADDSLVWDNRQNRMSLWVGSWEMLLPAKTRGDVRRLCAALGITLKEQEPKHD